MNLFKVISIVVLCALQTSFTWGARDTGIQVVPTISKSPRTVKKSPSKTTIKSVIYPSSTTNLTKGYNPATDVSSGAWVNKSISHPYYRESSKTKSYDLYISSGVYIFALNTGLTTIRNTSGINASKLQSDGLFDLVTNGGYFTYDRMSNGFLPAGRIVDGWNVTKSMVKEFWAPDLDVNLAVTMIYDKVRNVMSVTHQDLVVPKTNTYAFHTGPQVIQNGTTATGIQRNLSHRQRKAVRTFIVVDKNGKPHLGVTIQGYTLPALADKIIEMKVFDGNYQVINLDGGSSTALVAGTRSRNSRKRLPRFFGVKG